MRTKAKPPQRTTRRTPILTIELVPRTSWRRSLHKLLSRESWFELRNQFNASSGPCSICNEGTYDSALHLHEVWKYDDKKRVQKLVALQPICSTCHDVKHLGRAYRVGLGEKALEHLARINKWDAATTLEYVRKSFTKWDQRSRHRYELDVSYIDDFLYQPKLHPEWEEDDPRELNDKYDAVSWARDILQSDALILDTETTGLLTSASSEIIQLAVINMQGSVLYNKYIRPKRTIPKRTIDINHITNETVAKAPIFSELYPELISLLEGKTIVAYNKKFDRGMLKQTCHLYGLDEIRCMWTCAMLSYRDYLDCNGFPRLPGATHDAAEDCLKTLELVKLIAGAAPL